MLYRRGEYWYTRFTANKVKVNQSTKTKVREEAERFEARLRNQIWNQKQLGIQPQRLWEEAATSWIQTKQHKRSLDWDLQKLEWLESHFNGLPLSQITISLIETTLDKRDMGNATRNRWYAVIRGVLKRAKRLGWIDALPEIDTREEPPTTPQFLTHEQAGALMTALDTPRRQHLYDMVKFSLATGIREGNVTALTWDRVNPLHKFMFIRAEGYKGKRTLRVPLNSVAIDVLQSRAGIHPRYVFTYRGKPVRKANRDGFQSAISEAGVPWLRWHDLRHTWASWHVMAGTPLAVLKELGGWADLKMVMRYAHLSPDFAEGYAENVVQKVLHYQTPEAPKEAVNS